VVGKLEGTIPITIGECVEYFYSKLTSLYRCILRLGTAGTIFGFDIDTTNFNGNEAPQASVEALLNYSSGDPQANDSRWSEILPIVDLGPSSRHLFRIPESSCVNYVKLKIYPDGGIARFRVYGNVAPIFPADVAESFDLAHVFAGGCVEFVSDQHFGIGANLILPGRGVNMSDGWETKRSRQKGHKDWVIIKLGLPGHLEVAEIDTAHFMGNFPESVELHALHNNTTLPTNKIPLAEWTEILPRTKVGPHRRHFFQLENVEGKPYTHVKITIHPDGGLKRIRLVGKRADYPAQYIAIANNNGTSSGNEAGVVNETSNSAEIAKGTHTNPVASSRLVTTIPVLPLTPEAFAPFGKVIQAYEDHNAAPPGTKITSANQGTASKFHKLGLLGCSYPSEMGATAGLSVYRCNPLPCGEEWEVKILERHPFTTQAFIPMGTAGILKQSEDRLEDPVYLVVVTKNGPDDKPDLKTLRAFAASTAQGIMYNIAVWHQPMVVFNKPMDFTCVETQIGDDSKADCEIINLEGILKVKMGTAGLA